MEASNPSARLGTVQALPSNPLRDFFFFFLSTQFHVGHTDLIQHLETNLLIAQRQAAYRTFSNTADTTVLNTCLVWSGWFGRAIGSYLPYFHLLPPAFFQIPRLVQYNKHTTSCLSLPRAPKFDQHIQERTKTWPRTLRCTLMDPEVQGDAGVHKPKHSWKRTPMVFNISMRQDVSGKTQRETEGFPWGSSHGLREADLFRECGGQQGMPLPSQPYLHVHPLYLGRAKGHRSSGTLKSLKRTRCNLSKIRPKETCPTCNANKCRKYRLQGCLRFNF